MILDIHSHRKAPYPQGIISCSPDEFNPAPGQFYSVGIHPWNTDGDITAQIELLTKVASNPAVVAIGEAGIDLLKGGPMFRQLQAFNACIQISESLQKPLIIHCVKAYDVIAGLHRDLLPSQQWILHGFRGNPQIARMLTDKGIALSFGENFNPESLRVTPVNIMFAETDESSLPIEDIINKISDTYAENLLSSIEGNVERIFST